MTTLSKTYNHSSYVSSTSSLSRRYNQFIKKMEFSHFGLIAVAILAGSCLGSITTMQIFEHNAPLWQFILSLDFTMANLVACIGQAPTKWVVNLCSLSILANTILLLLNIL